GEVTAASTEDRYSTSYFTFFFFFFFQAEDGIRDKLVTGVQTCALPISGPAYAAAAWPVSTKIPVPMTAPTPSSRRSIGPSTRLSECAPEPSCSVLICSIDLVANNDIVCLRAKETRSAQGES